MVKGVVFNLKVIPNSGGFEISGFEESTNTIKLKARSPPKKGRANAEIEKELGKLFDSGAKIISGHGSRAKRLLITGVQKQQALNILNRFPHHSA